MSISMEEGEHNGDHLDRIEEVSCLAWQPHAKKSDLYS